VTQKSKATAMFKLMFRLSILAALAIWMMPSDPQQRAQLADKAAAAASWTLTFCERNDATCTEARQLWARFVEKAEFAGALLVSLAHEASSRVGEPARPARKEPAALDSGTLTQKDGVPPWRGGERGRI
jgi:hypothetical protein